MELVVVSGLSGGGKSKAVSYLEDMGYYCVDNLPASLIPKLSELFFAGTGKYDRVAVVVDIRGGQTFDGLFAALAELDTLGFRYKILFMEADTDVIIQRYKETRRSHPLAVSGRTLEEAVAMERKALEPVRSCAEYIINTSALSTGKLRGEILRLFGQEADGKAMSVSVTSFGFKYGIPIDADLVFDVRFLPNPHYLTELRPLTGLDEPVRSFVFGYQQTHDFLSRVEDLIAFLLPRYVEEGKTALVIAVGCTGGRHRSVSITRALAEFVRKNGFEAAEIHRDMMRG